ncbi:MAG TPA: isoprenylcysteine carboxylmethyltransferase family protein [Acidobacteriaceae bacterium]|nr:isoprenylcysteine carboxylmethyltransferase family protein [Acidobacteriaceae bacterium]
MPAVIGAVRNLVGMSRAMMIAVIILCIFSIYWSAASKNSKPAASSESKASRGFHVFLINAGFFLLVFSIPGLTRQILPESHLLEGCGLALELVGFALAVWARRALGSNWSGEVRIATGHQLVRSGPYRRIRHPIYTALLAMYGGTMLVSGELHALLAWLLIVLAYIRKLRMEEAAMASAFGDEFSAWRNNSWRLLPRVY